MPKHVTTSCSALAVAMAFCVIVAAPSDAAESSARALRVGMPLVPETLDPARADNMQAMMLMAGIYDTLYVLDPVARPAAIVPMRPRRCPRSPPITARSPFTCGRGFSSRRIRVSAASRAS